MSITEKKNLYGAYYLQWTTVGGDIERVQHRTEIHPQVSYGNGVDRLASTHTNGHRLMAGQRCYSELRSRPELLHVS